MKSVIKVVLTMAFVIFLAGCSQETSQSVSGTQSQVEESQSVSGTQSQVEESQSISSTQSLEEQSQSVSDGETAETQDSYYNEYGAVAFINRENYKDFEDYSEEEQKFISAMVEAAESGNVDAVLELLELYDESVDGSTIWNEYKIEFSRGSNVTNGGNDAAKSAAIIMRPEIGMGYYFEVIYTVSTAGSYVTYSKMSYYITCWCENWQWNGDFNETDVFDYSTFWTSRERTDTYVKTKILMGAMADNLRDGQFSGTILTVSGSSSSNTSDSSETTSFTELYVEGALMESDDPDNDGLISDMSDDGEITMIPYLDTIKGTLFILTRSTGYYDRESLLASSWLETLYW